MPVLIKASTTTGSRLKFVPSAFRESSILEDSLGTKLKELAISSRGSLPTRLSQSCALGGVPLLLHNDRGRDETRDRGGRRRRGGPNDTLSGRQLLLGRLSLPYRPTRSGKSSPPQDGLRTVFSVRWTWIKLATGNGSLHCQKGASCSYVSLCDGMKTGATTSSRDPGGRCPIGTDLACRPIASIFEVHLIGCTKRPLLFWPPWRWAQRGVSS